MTSVSSRTVWLLVGPASTAIVQCRSGCRSGFSRERKIVLVGTAGNAGAGSAAMMVSERKPSGRRHALQTPKKTAVGDPLVPYRCARRNLSGGELSCHPKPHEDVHFLAPRWLAYALLEKNTILAKDIFAQIGFWPIPAGQMAFSGAGCAPPESARGGRRASRSARARADRPPRPAQGTMAA